MYAFTVPNEIAFYKLENPISQALLQLGSDFNKHKPVLIKEMGCGDESFPP